MFAAVWGDSYTGAECGVIGIFGSRGEAESACAAWRRRNRNEGLAAWARPA